MDELEEIKQRLALFEASIDTDQEVWVCNEVGKYWHEDVPFLLRRIELLSLISNEPMTQDDVEMIDELVAKYGVNPQGGKTLQEILRDESDNQP